VVRTLGSRGTPDTCHSALREALSELRALLVVEATMTWWRVEEVAGALRRVTLQLMRALPEVQHPGVHPVYREWVGYAIGSTVDAVDALAACLQHHHRRLLFESY